MVKTVNVQATGRIGMGGFKTVRFQGNERRGRRGKGLEKKKSQPGPVGQVCGGEKGTIKKRGVGREDFGGGERTAGVPRGKSALWKR